MSFSVFRKDGLEYLISTIITTPHCFSTRLGGVSKDYLTGLNLGIHRGDRYENVLENYRILGEAVGFSPEDTTFSRQIHSDLVIRVGAADRGIPLMGGEPRMERDGMVTDTPNVALTVFGADCTTVLFHDPVRHAIAAVHSGWRGTAAGIVKNAVEKLTEEYGSDPADVRAAIGPCIGRCCFETHREVPDAMLAALGVDALDAVETIAERPGKYFVDLKRINEIWLRKAGVREIDICPDCTACRPDRYWSHRITNGHRGSQAAIITLK